MHKLLYAISGHGFGHATRALSVARDLKKQRPELQITISCAVEAEALKRFIPDFDDLFHLRQQAYEPGLIQKNCFEVDRQATRNSYRALARQLDEHIDRESDYLSRGGYDAVVSDVAAIPLSAATRLGLPSVVIGNFTWDWILEPLIEDCPDLSDYLQRLRRDYATAACYFQLPFFAQEHPCGATEPAPLIGRKSRLNPKVIQECIGIPEDRSRPLVLVAAGGWTSEGLPDIEVRDCELYRFLVVGDLPVKSNHSNVYRLPAALLPGITFPDLVHLADLGVVKPGFGTCAEFVLNQTRMVGVERKDMRETDILDPAVGKLVPFSQLSLADFQAGAWRDSLDEISHRPVPAYPDETMQTRQFIARVLAVLQNGGRGAK